MIYLLLLAMFFQKPIPPPIDKGVDVTHKVKHERTPYYAKDGKTLCGNLLEFRNGAWYGYVLKFGGIRSEAFKTRAEADIWLRVSCSVPGKVVAQ